MNVRLLFRPGIVFLFLSLVCAGSASAELTQTAYIKASNTGDSDSFGAGGTLEGDAVALSNDGSTLAVGAPYESSNASGVGGDQTDNSLYGAGAVYVFTQSGDGWVQQAYIKASNPGLTDNFGYMVALSADGNTMAVSAHFEAGGGMGVDADQTDDSIPQAGAVYLFSREGNQWNQQAYIKASNTGTLSQGQEFADGDQFGSALTLSDDGNTLAVSAVTEDSNTSGVNGDQSDNSAQSVGAVYVFNRDGSTWSQNAYLKPSNPDGGDLFGYAVSLTADGRRLAIGSFDEDGSLAGTNEQQDDETRGSGSVYVFDYSDDTWQQTAYLKASNTERNDAMGVAIAISDDGNTLVATALDEDSMSTGVTDGMSIAPELDWESDISTGAVYVWVYHDDTWTQQAYIKASNTGGNDLFGSRLALSGDGNTLALGAQFEDSVAQGLDGVQNDDSASEAGVVYLFSRTGNSWSQINYIKGSNTEEFDEFGSSMGLNRDGSLLAIGAQYEDGVATGVGGDETDNSSYDSGAVYLFSR
ncbi:MAG: integrin [Proteobacteria bacterium]|jgi:trimeric autotransporter adhesin|nr:integrin [Pseudomonadota bacterium]